MPGDWEYQVFEEPNPVALQERLTKAGREGWEPMSLGYAGECRLLALVRRPLPPATEPAPLEKPKEPR
jgi:hypothetical protein